VRTKPRFPAQLPIVVSAKSQIPWKLTPLADSGLDTPVLDRSAPSSTTRDGTPTQYACTTRDTTRHDTNDRQRKFVPFDTPDTFHDTAFAERELGFGLPPSFSGGSSEITRIPHPASRIYFGIPGRVGNLAQGKKTVRDAGHLLAIPLGTRHERSQAKGSAGFHRTVGKSGDDGNWRT
jgi:hypothetical protein